MTFEGRPQVKPMYIKKHKTQARKIRQLTELQVTLLADCGSVCRCTEIFPFLTGNSKGKPETLWERCSPVYMIYPVEHDGKLPFTETYGREKEKE